MNLAYTITDSNSLSSHPEETTCQNVVFIILWLSSLYINLYMPNHMLSSSLYLVEHIGYFLLWLNRKCIHFDAWDCILLMFSIWTCSNLFTHFPIDGKKLLPDFSYYKHNCLSILEMLHGTYLLSIYQGVQVIGYLHSQVYKILLNWWSKCTFFFYSQGGNSSIFFILHCHMIILLKTYIEENI